MIDDFTEQSVYWIHLEFRFQEV